jgi:hypothetical protein
LQTLKKCADRAIALQDSLTGFRSTGTAGLGCSIGPDHFIGKSGDACVEADLLVGS